jgi:hypothetical protein
MPDEAEKFRATCSCKTWIGYAGTETIAREAGESHVHEMERRPSPIQYDGAHVLTVLPDRIWN